MKILCVDTSTSAGSLHLSEGGSVLAEINVDSRETHSSRILPGLDCLLKAAGLDLRQIDIYAVIHGPGSFTGIRIGLTVVKALAEVNRKPVAAISALDAWVEKCGNCQGTVVPLIDARRGEVFGCVYEKAANSFSALTPGVVNKPEKILSEISAEDVVFVGGGAAKYREIILDGRHPGWRVQESDPFLGRAMVPLARQSVEKGSLVTAQNLEAYYLRKSDAELNWKER